MTLLCSARSTSDTLDIPSNSTSVATLSANSTLGLIRGLQTFTQLVYTLPSGRHRYIIDAPISIRDSPAFPHRAFMLDTSRAWFPVAGEYLPTFHLAWAELIPSLNRHHSDPRCHELGKAQCAALVGFLDLARTIVTHRLLASIDIRHATDSQSWPLFIPAFPELSRHGAYSSAKTYSRSDITLIQEYAGSLGITILLEVSASYAASSVGQRAEDLVAFPS